MNLERGGHYICCLAANSTAAPLGIPGDVITAVMLGALLIHDVVPSPAFIAEQPKIAYAIFIAFFFANFLVLALQPGALRGFVLVTKFRNPSRTRPYRKMR